MGEGGFWRPSGGLDPAGISAVRTKIPGVLAKPGVQLSWQWLHLVRSQAASCQSLQMLLRQGLMKQVWGARPTGVFPQLCPPCGPCPKFGLIPSPGSDATSCGALSPPVEKIAFQVRDREKGIYDCLEIDLVVAREIGQGIGHLPCTQPTQVLFPAP